MFQLQGVVHAALSETPEVTLLGVQVARDALEGRCSELKEWGSSYKKRGEEADEQLNKANVAIEKLTVISPTPKPSALLNYHMLATRPAQPYLLSIL